MAKAQYRTWYGGVMHRWGIFETKDGWEFIPPVDLQAPQLQNTGLKDKNGKEIYEGDILKSRIATYIVEFKNGSFQTYCLDGVSSRKYRGLTNGIIGFEVIGNIYENPELLNS